MSFEFLFQPGRLLAQSAEFAQRGLVIVGRLVEEGGNRRPVEAPPGLRETVLPQVEASDTPLLLIIGTTLNELRESAVSMAILAHGPRRAKEDGFGPSYPRRELEVFDTP